ncbi:MAG: winged helix-turn-helix transcriptional regulator [Candidatus Nitrosothermus koennekii]|nr:MAG: winged helix-turn-helix transcriptional regulator [Candidatus Nitrosothermus koennekii]
MLNFNSGKLTYVILLDEIDLKIIDALMKDGRKSFREIAREVGISTPTVKTRFDRLVKIGVIKKIVPIIDADKITNNINVAIMLKCKPNKVTNVIDELIEFDEVRKFYLLSNNIMLISSFSNPRELDEFLTRINGIDEIIDVSSQLITRIVKDEQIGVIDIGSMIKVRCEYCNKEIDKPLITKIKGYERYFCCTSCITLYKEKYRA